MCDANTVIIQTKKWLSSVVIAHTLCPFAKREFDANRIHYAVVETEDIPSQLEQVINHCAALDKDTNRETTLLIFPTALSDFQDYLDVLDLATDLMHQQGYDGVYQLASFHPKYCFAGVSQEDASNYTNRSPYPIFHILREASVTAALNDHPNPHTIPTRNIKLTRELGLEIMRTLLADCYK